MRLQPLSLGGFGISLEDFRRWNLAVGGDVCWALEGDVVLCRGIFLGFRLFRYCGRWLSGGGTKLDEFVDLSVFTIEYHCIAS